MDLVAVLWTIAYFIVGTIVGAKAAVMYHARKVSDPGFTGFVTGAVWPVGICLLIGARLMDRGLEKAKRREEALKERERAVQERERLLEATRRELEAL